MHMKRFLALSAALLLLFLSACSSARPADSETVYAEPELTVTPDEGDLDGLHYSNPYLALSGVSRNTAQFFSSTYSSIHDEYARQIRTQAKQGAVSFTVTYEQRAMTSRLISILRVCTIENADGTVTAIPGGETFDPQTGLRQNAQIFFICPIEVAKSEMCQLLQPILEDGGYFGFSGLTPVLRDDWSTRLEKVFTQDNFVLTESGYLVFFTPGQLSDEAVGVYLPYREMTDILVLPQ